MPGDLPGVDSNEDKEVWEYVFEVGAGSLEGGGVWGGWGGGCGWDHHRCRSQGWFTLGGCQASERSSKLREECLLK